MKINQLSVCLEHKKTSFSTSRGFESGLICGLTSSNSLIIDRFIHQDELGRTNVPAVNSYTCTNYVFSRSNEYFLVSHVHSEAIHLNVSQRYVKFVETLDLHKIVNSMSIVTNSKTHSANRVFVSLFCLLCSRSMNLYSSKLSDGIRVHVIRSSRRTFKVNDIFFQFWVSFSKSLLFGVKLGLENESRSQGRVLCMLDSEQVERSNILKAQLLKGSDARNKVRSVIIRRRKYHFVRAIFLLV